MSSRRSGLGCLLVLVVLVGLLVGGALVGDEWLRRNVERQVGDQLTTALSASQPVEVELDDWPFTVSLLRNRLENGSVHARNVQLLMKNRTVEVAALDVNLAGLSPMRDPTNAVIESAQVTALLGWDAIRAATETDVHHLGDNRVGLTTTAVILRSSVTFEISGVAGIDPATGQLTISQPTARFAGVEVPQVIVERAVAALAPQLTLPAQPGIAYKSLAVAAEGVTIVMTGTKVDVSQLR